VPPQKALINDNVYDVLKNTVELVLPALGALYFALAGFWGWPNAEAVVGSIAAVTVFLGVVLRVARNSYHNSSEKYSGSVEVVHNAEGEPVVTLNLPEDPGALLASAQKNGDVILKVNQ
jgi:hypothetical protein